MLCWPTSGAKKGRKWSVLSREIEEAKEAAELTHEKRGFLVLAEERVRPVRAGLCRAGLYDVCCAECVNRLTGGESVGLPCTNETQQSLKHIPSGRVSHELDHVSKRSERRSRMLSDDQTHAPKIPVRDLGHEVAARTPRDVPAQLTAEERRTRKLSLARFGMQLRWHEDTRRRRDARKEWETHDGG
jgi:hypothetical protein